METHKNKKHKKYRYWDILDELPEGWVIDKTNDAPIKHTVFITNGKSVFNGQKRALMKVKVEKKDTSFYHPVEPNEVVKKNEIQIFPAKTVNILARKKFQEHLLKEITFDLMVCEIENWDKKEYINELKKLINSI